VTPTLTRNTAMTRLAPAEPQRYVHDVVADSELYSRVPGFSVALTHGEPPIYNAG